MDTAKLRDELARDEGVRLTVYDDATGAEIVSGSRVQGHPTIGVGRNLTAARGISRDECDALLDDDIRLVAAELDRELPWWSGLSDARQRALANMCFNLGMPRLRQFRNMLAALEAGDFETAAREALDSRWAGQVGARAERIAAQIRDG
jgi:lysozyme